MFNLIGVITEKRDVVAETYARAIGTRSILEASSMRDEKVLMAWARRSVSYKKRKVVMVLTDTVVPYLFMLKERYNPQVVSVRFDHTQLVFDYDAVFMPHEIGWGVDKKKWARVAKNRRPKDNPTFFMLSRDESMERRIMDRGCKVAYGGPERFYLGDVAIQPRKVNVPTLMYEAAASGMGVISTKDNAVWTDRLGVYDGVRIEGGVDFVVGTVWNSDFVYAGSIARDMVLSMDEFRVRMRSLLKANLRDWS